jgi:tripartite-type tricarboxylate transporter receptor subunit TctC
MEIWIDSLFHRAIAWRKCMLKDLFAGWRRSVAAVLLGVLAGTAAQAAEPASDRPVRMIVPWVVGGSTDALARLLAEAMSARLGQSILVENRPGAAGTIGTNVVVRATPDGNTILLGTNSTFAMAPHLYADLPYDHARDLMPVGLVAGNQQILCVNPAVPVKTLPGLVEYLKGHAGQVVFESAGNGGSSHMAMELFMSMTDTRMLHIPYKGGAPAVQSLMGNETNVGFVDVTVAIPLIQSGRLIALGSSGQQRAPGLGDLPTIGEAGVAGFDSQTSFGLFVPKGTVPARIQALNKALNDALADPAMADKLARMGFDRAGGTPEFLGRYVQTESDKWGRLIAERNIKIQ